MAKKKPQPIAAPAISELVIERVVALLVTFRSRAAAKEACVTDPDFALTPDVADAAIAEAQRRINLAAAIDFDRELGTAKTRLNDLYEKSIDPRVALRVQKELNKLLNLYPGKMAGGDGPDEDDLSALEQLAAVREHLAPLVDGVEDEPCDEIARRVVAKFTAREKPDKGSRT